MTWLRALLGRIWARGTTWANAFARAASGAFRGLYGAVRHAVSRVVGRWRRDTFFRRTITAAVTALATTALTHPAAGAVVAALLTSPAPARLDRFEPYDEEDEDPSRSWQSGRPLWDRLD